MKVEEVSKRMIRIGPFVGSRDQAASRVADAAQLVQRWYDEEAGAGKTACEVAALGDPRIAEYWIEVRSPDESPPPRPSQSLLESLM